MNIRGKVFQTLQNLSNNELQWDGKDKSGRYMDSGIYLVVSSHPDHRTSIEKLAIIREN